MESEVASDQVPSYNLYRVYFTQPNSPDHEALALVEEDASLQTKGILHHVTGLVALGMEYTTRSSRDFRKEKGYSHQTLLGRIKEQNMSRFEVICRNIEVPYDDRLLFESRSKLEARGEKNRDCVGWINDVLTELEKEGILSSAS